MTKLIKYGSSWCGPCKVLIPILKELKNKIEIEEFDVDKLDNLILIEKKIRNIPVLIIEKDNVEVWRHVGSISKIELEKKIEKFT